MADPLSIASSIAGVIALADVVFIRLVKYAKAVKDAADDVKALASEVRALGGTLYSLSLLARSLEDEPFDATLRMHHIEGCHLVLSKIEKLLQKAEADFQKPSPLDSLQRKLKWPLSSSKVKELMVELSRHQQSITMAVSADNMNALLRHLSMTSEVLGGVSEIMLEVRETRKITTRIHEDAERRKVLDFFIHVKPQDYYETSLGLRHPRTGLWLMHLPEFQTWLTMPGSKLWLSGIPGAGKTVLTGSIIEAALARSSESVAVAFFFCDYRDEKTKQAVEVLGALVTQLAMQNDDAYAILEACYNSLHPARGLPKKATVQILSGVLREIIATYSQTYIIVDGLDECGKHVDEVVQALVPLDGLGETLSIALISRDEGNIKDILADEFKNIEISAHSQDIAEYVSAQIEERLRTKRLRISDIALKGEIRQSLIDGAGGMFRWVACQLDHLGDCYTDKACREALKRLPPDLPETYCRILQRVPEGQVELVQMVLNIIAFSDRRMEIRELLQALSIPDSGQFDPTDVIHEDAIVRSCSSLIRKGFGGASFIFAHFSVQEFLTSSYLDKYGLSHFRISKSECYRLLARQCLRFLLLKNFSTRPPPAAKSLISLIKSRHEEYPFYQFASLYWFLYARGAWEDKEVFDLAVKLFDSRKTANFTYWCMELSPKSRTTEQGGWLGGYKATDSELADVLANITHRGFRPLHMAAILALSEICQHLIERDSGTNLSGASPFGTPIRCALEGLRIFEFDKFQSDDYRIWYQTVLGEDVVPACVSDTIRHLIAAAPESVKSQKLLASGCIAAYLLKDFSIVSTLLAANASMEGEDLKSCEQMLKLADSWALENRAQAEQAFRPFVQALNKLIDKSPEMLDLCSMVWKKALHWGLPCAMDPGAVSSQISRADESLAEWAFSAVGSADLDSLEEYLEDPRARPAEIRNLERDTLLHVALRGGYAGIDIQDRLAIFKRLLEAGCDPQVTDGKGRTVFHWWAWDAQPSESDVLEDVVRSVYEAGFDITIEDDLKDNIIHANIYRLTQLKAMLGIFPEEELDKALRQVNGRGNTPLAEAFNMGFEDAAISLLAHGHHSEETWKGSVPTLQMAARLGSAPVLQKLLDLGLKVDDAADLHPLHFIDHSISLRCLQLLKSLDKDGLGKRAEDGRLPVEVYLRECLRSYTLPSQDIFNELAVQEDHPDLNREKMLVWQYFAEFLIQVERGRAGGPERLEFEIVRLGALFLVEGGYLAAYESETRRSGIEPLMGPFKGGYEKTRPVSCRLLLYMVDETKQWASVLEDTELCFTLMMTAYHVRDTKLLEKFLKKGIGLWVSDKELSALELMVRYKQHESDLDRTKAIFKVIAEYVEGFPVNELNPRSSDRALIHQAATANSPWMVQELLRWGCDPSLAAGKKLHHETAIMYHIRQGSFSSARQLLRSGADPTARNDAGFDCSLMACFFNFNDLLWEMFMAKEQPWVSELDWTRTCEFTQNPEKSDKTIKIEGANAFHLAAFRGNIEAIAFYRKHDLLPGGVISETQPLLMTPLHFAAANDDVDMIEYLIRAGADVNAETRELRTPLHYAVRFDSARAVDALLRLGATLPPDMNGENPLSMAYREGNDNIIARVKSAFQAHAALAEAEATGSNSAAAAVVPARMARGSERAFAFAVSSGDLEGCKSLFARGCSLDVDLRCGGCSPLFVAIENVEVETAMWLLEQGASTTKASCADHDYGTVLLYVLSKKSSKLVPVMRMITKRFVEEGGEIFHASYLNVPIGVGNYVGLKAVLDAMRKEFETRKHIDTENGKPKDIWDLLRAGIQGKVRHPLNVAVDEGDVRAIKLLLARGAGREAKERDKLQRVLAMAAWYPERERGPDRDDDNWAEQIKDWERMMALLLDGDDGDADGTGNGTGDGNGNGNGNGNGSSNLKADPSALDHHGLTPLMHACRDDLSVEAGMAVVQRFLDAGADPSVQSVVRGATALHMAAESGLVRPFASMVLTGKVDPHARDAYGVSALHLAVQRREFTSLLLNGDYRIEDMDPLPWTFRAAGEGRMNWVGKSLKRFYWRRIRDPEDRRRILNLKPAVGWSPLCQAAVVGKPRAVEALLDAEDGGGGAEIDYEGCPDGSALMAACRAGRLRNVKVLVRRGARELYVTKEGVVRSALKAAVGSEAVVRWLLVGRWTEQLRITAAPEGAAGEGSGDELASPSSSPSSSREKQKDATSPTTSQPQQPPPPGRQLSRVGTWGSTTAGPLPVGKAEYVLMDMDERLPTESSWDYYLRLIRYKKRLRGTVISLDPRRRTVRPSRLVPVETVKVHPLDRRAPRNYEA